MFNLSREMILPKVVFLLSMKRFKIITRHETLNTEADILHVQTINEY